MPNTNIDSRKPALAVALILILACLGLVACGGSSSSTSTTASTATNANANATGANRAGGRDSGRFAALRACLQKDGITLPQRAPGTGRPPGGAGSGPGLPGARGNGGGLQLPKGVTRTQLQSAMRKCGGGFGGTPGANSGAFRQSLSKFVACMAQNGVKLPAPNTSGKGPVFKTQGLNTASKQFKAAQMKCQSSLRGNFRRVPPQGAPGAGGPAAGGPGTPATKAD